MLRLVCPGIDEYGHEGCQWGDKGDNTDHDLCHYNDHGGGGDDDEEGQNEEFW